MTQDRLSAVPVAALDSQQAAGVVRIYEQAFPEHLRVPFGELASTGPRDQLLVALDGRAAVGFAATKRLSSADWVFLRYFAIARDRRRERFGQRLWELLRDSVAASGRPERIVFEVEHPGEADDDEDRAVRQNRIDFWLSCGTVPLPVPGYVMPALTPAAAPEPMLLMAAAPASDVRGDQLSALVRALYRDRYALTPSDDLVRKALNSLAAGN